MRKPIAERELVRRVDVVIEARGSQVVAGIVVEESSLRFKLVLEEGVNRCLAGAHEGLLLRVWSRVYRQEVLEPERAGSGGQRGNSAIGLLMQGTSVFPS